MGLFRRFRLLFKPLHSAERYYANYDYVRALDLSKLSIYSKLKSKLQASTQPALDFGCGIGYVTHFLGIRGIDPNPDAVTRARQFFPQGSYDCLDLDGLKREGKRWGTIVCVNVIEHFEDDFRERFFNTVPKLLAPGGRLLIVYDSMYHPLQLASGFLHPGMLLTDPTHVHCWPQWQFRKLLERHFKVVEDEGGNILSRGLPWTNRFSSARIYVCEPRD